MERHRAKGHLSLSELYELSKADEISDPIVVTHLRACHD